MESGLPEIEDEYKRLLYLHRRIYDLKYPEVDFLRASSFNSTCRIPHKVTISPIKLIHAPYKIAICLPPKCGTTNWQKAMNVLEKDAIHEPPPSGEKYWKPEDFKWNDGFYTMLTNADITKTKDKDAGT